MGTERKNSTAHWAPRTSSRAARVGWKKKREGVSVLLFVGGGVEI